jgi:hypothetical protein
MRIAVYTLTRDRLEYTQRSFASLRKFAGVPFTHFVVDQASSDGTVEWLRDVYKPAWSSYLPENVGIASGANIALDAIFSQGEWDLVVKMDNDCLVLSENILMQIAEIIDGVKPFQARYMLSPRVEGIEKQPRRSRDVMVERRRVGVTGLVGGLFHCLPGYIYRQFRYDPDTTPRGGGNDVRICVWFRSMGGECGYIEGLAVEHMDTTVGQIAKYGEYHERKQREMQEDTA